MKTRHYNQGEYYDGILVAYNIDENYDVTDTFVDISGKGCRTIEALNPDFNWHSWLMQYYDDIYNRKAHISRIDIACDVDDDTLDLETMQEYAMNGYYICKSKVLPDVRYKRTEEIYFGSPKSDRLLRIYNKALEQGIPDTKWLRLEFQLRNDNAISFFLNWRNIEDIGKLYKGMMIDYLRFIDPADKDVDNIKFHRNQSRLETVYWWRNFIAGCANVSQLYLPAGDYTIERLEHYLEKQTYSSLKAYLIAHDGDITKLLEGVKHKKLNQKQKQVLSQLPNIKNSDYEYDIFK